MEYSAVVQDQNIKLEEFLQEREYVRQSQINELLQKMQGSHEDFNKQLPIQNQSLFNNFYQEIQQTRKNFLQRNLKVYEKQDNVKKQVSSLKQKMDIFLEENRIQNETDLQERMKKSTNEFQRQQQQLQNNNFQQNGGDGGFFTLNKDFFENKQDELNIDRIKYLQEQQQNDNYYDQPYNEKPEFLTRFKFTNISYDISQKRKEIQKNLRQLKTKAGKQFVYGQQYEIQQKQNNYNNYDEIKQGNNYIDKYGKKRHTTNESNSQNYINIQKESFKNMSSSNAQSTVEQDNFPQFQTENSPYFNNNNNNQNSLENTGNQKNLGVQSSNTLFKDLHNPNYNLDYSQSISRRDFSQLNQDSMDYSPFDTINKKQQRTTLDFTNQNRHARTVSRSNKQRRLSAYSQQKQSYQNLNVVQENNYNNDFQYEDNSVQQFVQTPNNQNQNNINKFNTNNMNQFTNESKVQQEEIQEDIFDNSTNLQEWMKNDDGVVQSYNQQSMEQYNFKRQF